VRVRTRRGGPRPAAGVGRRPRGRRHGPRLPRAPGLTRQPPPQPPTPPRPAPHRTRGDVMSTPRRWHRRWTVPLVGGLLVLAALVTRGAPPWSDLLMVAAAAVAGAGVVRRAVRALRSRVV